MKAATFITAFSALLACVNAAPVCTKADVVRTVALSGQPTPGLPSGINFAGFSTVGPVINDAGQTAFRSSLSGTGVDATNDQAIWSEGSGSLGPVARTGDQAPGAPNGIVFQSLSGVDLRLNNAGRAAFTSFLSGSGIDATNDRGAWSQGPGGLELIYRKGDQAPGTPSGVLYGNDGLPYIGFVFNDAGQAAFHKSLTGPGVSSTNNYAIWSGEPDNIGLVAREGDHAPGTPSGVNFSSFDYFSLGLNDVGWLAFQARLSGTGVDGSNDQGIWAGTPANLSLVVRRGDQVPGMTSGVNFFDIISNSTHVNTAGQIAFTARFVGPGVSSGIGFSRTCPAIWRLLLVKAIRRRECPVGLRLVFSIPTTPC